MKKAIAMLLATVMCNRTLFTGNRSKRNGLYIRYYSGRTGNR